MDGPQTKADDVDHEVPEETVDFLFRAAEAGFAEAKEALGILVQDVAKQHGLTFAQRGRIHGQGSASQDAQSPQQS